MKRPVIICVDDETTVLKSLKAELKAVFEGDYLIEIAQDGKDALELIGELLQEGHEIPLIVSDYIMPDMKGDELLRRVHQLSPQTLKVMLTGQASIEAVANAIQYANLYRYLAKPWQNEDLQLTVTEALRRYQQERQLAEQHRELRKVNEKLAALTQEQAVLIDRLHGQEQALQEANRTLEERVVQRTQELSQALEDLQATQATLIHSEKMAALGQLIAGVAHEINTPMGAIRAAIANLEAALARSLVELPQLFERLTPQEREGFLAFWEQARAQPQLSSSREERAARRALAAQLAALGWEQGAAIAADLVGLGVTANLEPFFELLQSPQGEGILAAAKTLNIQKNNSATIRLAVEKAAKIVFALKYYAHQDNEESWMFASLQEGIEVVLTIYHNALKRGVELIKRFEPLPKLRCCPDELNQVWTNLIHNAIQAMAGQGRLTIELFQEGSWAVARFTDSGSGIPPQLQEQIFTPFFTTKPLGEGSGLGLSIARTIVDKHQGKIILNSSQPGCTTFSVYLPLEGP